MTQAQLALSLGVVQSRVADIERDPGTVSVDQLMNVLAMLGVEVVVRETEPPTLPRAPSNSPDGQAPALPASAGSPDSERPQADASTSSPTGLSSAPSSNPPSPPSPPAHPHEAPGEEPRCQW